MAVAQGRRVPVRLLVALSLVLSSCVTLPTMPPWADDEAADCAGGDCKYSCTKACKKPTMHALACDLDCLEKHIDKYGSVVAKQPDIWGQARLTKYRDEFEKEMFKEYTLFKDTLQGSISRSDQAYFANAFALSAAISSQQAGATAPRPRIMVQTSSAQGQQSVTPTPIPVPDATLQTDVFKGFDSIQRSPLTTPIKLGFGAVGAAGIALEPVIHLDQKARYLDHLNQIRRNNEGDDTADSPGYSLNLVRIPVSVLPGKCTERGHGAEITFTMTPYVSDELLPTTFRQLAMNDLVDLLALPVVKVADSGLAEEFPALLAQASQIRESVPELEAQVEQLAKQVEELKKAVVKKVKTDETGEIRTLDNARAGIRVSDVAAISPQMARSVRSEMFAKLRNSLPEEDQKQVDAWSASTDKLAEVEQRLGEKRRQLRAKQLTESTISALRSSPRQRVALLTLPPSQLVDVLGPEELAITFRAVNRVMASHMASQNRNYLLDARSVLREELSAAYDLLGPTHRGDLWAFCTPDLARAIRSGHQVVVEDFRNKFMASVTPAVSPAKAERTITFSLAWAIVVESALLNERLIQDMREATAAKGCACQHPEALPFFLPDPPAEARQAFNEYVRCRWPIHVFALDPMEQDQNIADAYSRRQEMQLALSLAFVSGNMNARNMTRYARRLEKDMETIQINRTQVGFSHGEDVFGWRFYPRLQSPQFESNAVSLFRDQLWGGPSRKAELRDPWLEPGIRECVAIVLMPSFVPYVTCESSSNWFKLADPKCKEFTTAEAVKLGHKLKGIYTCGPNVANAECYRDGDLARMLAKAKQLEARLPLQNTQVQVPYENTLGGFEMFNTGITDLAPQLRGWYGGPGVNPKADTQLFLVGDHFSVHHTKVTAGGKDVDFELISRQIMRVTIPKGTMANERPIEAKPDAEKAAAPAAKPATFKYVDVHVATPYGVTAHLEIPVVSDETAAAAAAGPAEKNTGLTWNPSAVEIPFVYAAGGIVPAVPPLVRPPVTIKWDTKKLGQPSADTYDLKLAFAKPYGDAKVTYPYPFDESAALILTIPATNMGNPVTVSAAAGGTTKVLVVPNELLLPAVIGRFAGYFGPRNINPPVPVRLNKAVLVAKSANTVITQIEVGNELTITWQDVAALHAVPTDLWRPACCPPPCPLGFWPPIGGIPQVTPGPSTTTAPKPPEPSQAPAEKGPQPQSVPPRTAPPPAALPTPPTPMADTPDLLTPPGP